HTRLEGRHGRVRKHPDQRGSDRRGGRRNASRGRRRPDVPKQAPRVLGASSQITRDRHHRTERVASHLYGLRMTTPSERATAYLHEMLNEDASFRPGQLEAILAVAEN